MPHHGVVAFVADSVGESVLLLYGGAKTLEVQPLTLPRARSSLLHGPPQVVLTPHQTEGLYFRGGPSLLHPLADATGLPPTATAVHPYKAWTVL